MATINQKSPIHTHTKKKKTQVTRKKKRTKRKTKSKATNKMAIRAYKLVITLNANAPTNRHRLAEWIKKQDPYLCCLQETHFRETWTESWDMEKCIPFK